MVILILLLKKTNWVTELRLIVYTYLGEMSSIIFPGLPHIICTFLISNIISNHIILEPKARSVLINAKNAQYIPTVKRSVNQTNSLTQNTLDANRNFIEDAMELSLRQPRKIRHTILTNRKMESICTTFSCFYVVTNIVKN